MKVKIMQFLSSNHSWRIVGENIARALIDQNHEVHLQSTNGYETFPKDLEKHIRHSFDKTYDMQISYTAMKNFGPYLNNGTKNRFGIWNYETTVLPEGFARHHQFCDKMLPSSPFAKKVFVDGGVPDDKLVVVPHGINVSEYSNTDVYKLKTEKSKKILSNIAQPHIRKNIEGLFESFGEAFTKDDDVCLVCKISVKPQENKEAPKRFKDKRSARRVQSKETNKNEKPKMDFDVDFWSIYNKFLKKYPNHAEVEIITEFLPSMVPLYNACDIVFSMTRAECFWLPGLEGMATDNLVIAPNWGGQLEYMNDGNSLLISGKEVRAPKSMQYWSQSAYAAMFDPSIEDSVAKLKLAVSDYDNLMVKFRPGMKDQLDRLTWDKVVRQITSMCV